MPVPDVREWHVCWHARLAAMGARLPDEWASRPPQVIGRKMFQYMARTTSGLSMQVRRQLEALYGPLEADAVRRLGAICASPGGKCVEGRRVRPFPARLRGRVHGANHVIGTPELMLIKPATCGHCPSSWERRGRSGPKWVRATRRACVDRPTHWRAPTGTTCHKPGTYSVEYPRGCQSFKSRARRLLPR